MRYLCPHCNEWHNDSISNCPETGKKIASHMKYLGKEISGKYRILKIIGKGGMGTVYEAEHTSLEKKFAVKILLPVLAGDHDTVVRFEREAKAAAKVEHEHIISVTDIDEDDDGTPYIVMELLEGESLHEALSREKPLPVTTGVDIMLQILLALHTTHDKGIVHRDLKPENIFLTRFAGKSNWVKILDFGIAKFKESPGGFSLTSEGALLGTPNYMAPEQLQKGEPIDARTDLFACGVILYQVVTGKLPFDPPNVSGLPYEILHTNPPHPWDVEPSVPKELGDIITTAMSKKADHRYQSALDMARALKDFGSGAFDIDHALAPGAGESTAVPLPTAQTNFAGFATAERRPFNKKMAISISLITLVLAAVAILAWYYQRSGDHENAENRTQVLASGQQEKDPPETGGELEKEKTAGHEAQKSGPEGMAEIVISTEPADAVILLDGAVLPGNPHKSNAPPDGSLHRLEVRLEGYRKHSEWLKFEEDLNRHIILEKDEVGTGKKKTAKAKGKTGKKAKDKKEPSTKFIDANPYKKK